jgi:hypothetical protein
LDLKNAIEREVFDEQDSISHVGVLEGTNDRLYDDGLNLK